MSLNINIGGALHPSENIGGAQAPPAPPLPTPMSDHLI